jgi:hypothetical protein
MQTASLAGQPVCDSVSMAESALPRRLRMLLWRFSAFWGLHQAIIRQSGSG